MKNKLGIAFMSFLIGLIMAAGFTVADGFSCVDASPYAVAEEFADAEIYDASQFEPGEQCYPNVSARRTSSRCPSAGKSHGRQYLSKEFARIRETLLLNLLKRQAFHAVPQTLCYGSTLIVKLHRLLI